MKAKGILRFLFLVTLVVAVVGAYMKGRNDVLIGEFKQYQATMLTLTHWETNQPAQLTEFVKAHYYYLANRTPRTWVGTPYDYGAVSTNVQNLTGFKGPTSAQEEYRLFLARFGPALSGQSGRR